MNMYVRADGNGVCGVQVANARNLHLSKRLKLPGALKKPAKVIAKS
jgi:hypothetical protein